MSQTLPRWTQGFTSRDFRVAEIVKMQDLGLIGEDDKFERLEGEIVPPTFDGIRSTSCPPG